MNDRIFITNEADNAGENACFRVDVIRFVLQVVIGEEARHQCEGGKADVTHELTIRCIVRILFRGYNIAFKRY
jgi:hypothetical protein